MFRFFYFLMFHYVFFQINKNAGVFISEAFLAFYQIF